jgi:hypothetical protein
LVFIVFTRRNESVNNQVEEWNKAETGLEAAMAAGNREEQGI